MGQNAAFRGAKAALFLGEQLVVILRDETPGLPFPGHWDLPGGGREGDESPFDCLARECREELGLTLREGDLHWQRAFRSGGDLNWFFVARLPEDAVRRIVFGDEGQGWCLMSVRQFLTHPRAVPQFQARLRLALRDMEGDGRQESPPLP